VDNRWVPSERGYSLYLRPTLISTHVSPFSTQNSFVLILILILFILKRKKTLESPLMSVATLNLQPVLGVGQPGKAMLFVIACPVGPYYKSGESLALNNLI
jgi:branched-subunit amino acid aminotransferase/4-amino-4-deoxychorismate lyase